MYDLVVIGGGPGGTGVASDAAQVGARVALIEQDERHLGGSCRVSACVPSKTLLKAAQVAQSARDASRFGIHAGAVSVDFPAVMARVRDVVASFGVDAAQYYRDKGIDVIFGRAAFESYDSVVVDGRTRVEGSRFVVATGSRPLIPPIPGLREAGFLTNETIWNLEALPESLLILGAGPVGLEFGQAFARLGSRVTILDVNSQILHREDPDAAEFLRARLAAEGITFFLDVEVTGVGPKDGKTLVKFRSRKDGATFEALRTHLLVATGRLANVEGLNLEAAGIHASAEHGIAVDDHLATESRHVYAIGDVNGLDPYTHGADRQAQVVFENAVLKCSRRYRRDAVPRVVYTDPEFASAGMTEAEARDHDADVRVVRLDLGRVTRVRIDGESGGLAKVFAAASGKILGAVMVGPWSSLVLQEFVAAIENGVALQDLAATIHPYPSHASAAWSLGRIFEETRRGEGFRKTALKWFYGFEAAKP